MKVWLHFFFFFRKKFKADMRKYSIGNKTDSPLNNIKFSVFVYLGVYSLTINRNKIIINR